MWRWRVDERGIDEDLEFLDRVRNASLEELRVLERNHSHKRAPPWKKVAIQRALMRKKER